MIKSETDVHKNPIFEGYTLGQDGLYLKNKLSRGFLRQESCPQCGNYLRFVFTQKYSFLKAAGILVAIGIKVYGLECNTCKCGFIYNV
jgi:hypothetical protein